MSRRSWLAPPLLLLAGLIAGCSGTPEPPARPGRGAEPTGNPVLGGSYKVGKPYQINGRWYYPAVDADYSREGIASWYGAQFHGLSTANGEIFDKETVSAAHPTLPLPSLVKVTNLENNKAITVRVNDRGPFVDDRLIDLSQAAARELGFEHRGLARVRVEFVEIADGRGPPPAASTTVASLERRPLTPAQPDAGDVVRATFVTTDPGNLGAERITEATAVTHEPPQRVGPMLVASLARPAPAGPRTCAAGPHWVQVGAFGDTARVRLASARLAGLEAVRTEPVFIGESAAMRVRLGPTADRPAAERLLALVRARGYDDAYLVPTRQGAPRIRC